MSVPQLRVSSGPLQAAFKTLDRLLAKRAVAEGEIVLKFADGILYVEGPGASVDVPAVGAWPGRARLPARFVKVFARAPPEGNPLVLEFDNQAVLLRGTTTVRFNAAWEDISSKVIEVPLDLSDVDLLKAKARETSETLVSSGLRLAVQQAEDRFQECLDCTYKTLAGYAFSRTDFEEAVRRLIVG